MNKKILLSVILSLFVGEAAIAALPALPVIIPATLKTENQFSTGITDANPQVSFMTGSTFSTGQALGMKLRSVTIYSDANCTENPRTVNLSSNAWWNTGLTIPATQGLPFARSIHINLSAADADAAAITGDQVYPTTGQCIEYDVLYDVSSNGNLIDSDAVLQCRNAIAANDHYTGCTVFPSTAINLSAAGQLGYADSTPTPINLLRLTTANTGSLRIQNLGTAAITGVSIAVPAVWTPYFTLSACGTVLAAGAACTLNYTISSTVPRTGNLALSVTATNANNNGLILPVQITAPGAAQCWGLNSGGQLGDNSLTSSDTPVDVSGLSGLGADVVSIATGVYHTCALLSSGRVTCWGFNGYGQLGDDSTTDRSIPVDVKGSDGTSSLTGVVSIATGGYHTCALLSSGGVTCWGFNGYGQLGDDSTTDSSIPVSVSNLSGAVSIATGGLHTCVLLNTGGVRCWGSSGKGQLGNGTLTNSSVPVDVSGLSSGVVSIATGVYHTCALLSTGGVKCWGDNYYGQLGDDSTTDRSIPVDVKGSDGTSSLTGVVSIATGGYHTCALLSSGGVTCWGYNGYGQLGDDSTTDRSIPVDVKGSDGISSLTGVVSIATGGLHTCALLSSGGVTCWGYNGYGQLGNDSTTDSNIPVNVLALGGAAEFANGLYMGTGLGFHSCVILVPPPSR